MGVGRVQMIVNNSINRLFPSFFQADDVDLSQRQVGHDLTVGRNVSHLSHVDEILPRKMDRAKIDHSSILKKVLWKTLRFQVEMTVAL
jgi:hypothetical protein